MHSLPPHHGTTLPTVVLRLYIIGNSPKSLQARATLEAICHQYLPGRHTIELVDVLDEPLRLLKDGIPVTPVLVKLAPPPVQKLLGDLSDRAQVLLHLGLGPDGSAGG